MRRTNRLGCLSGTGIMAAILTTLAITGYGFASGGVMFSPGGLNAAVCGTGLDTIPLPGDTRADQLVPLLLDVSALALRLNKPLTARLMPIPGKQAGDLTNFDFAFFARSKVMALESAALMHALAGTEIMPLSSRR